MHRPNCQLPLLMSALLLVSCDRGPGVYIAASDSQFLITIDQIDRSTPSAATALVRYVFPVPQSTQGGVAQAIESHIQVNCPAKEVAILDVTAQHADGKTTSTQDASPVSKTTVQGTVRDEMAKIVCDEVYAASKHEKFSQDDARLRYLATF